MSTDRHVDPVSPETSAQPTAMAYEGRDAGEIGDRGVSDRSSRPPTIMDEIDARQDALLADLDALSARVDHVLRAWTAAERNDP